MGKLVSLVIGLVLFVSPAKADSIKISVEKASALFQALSMGLNGAPSSPGAPPVPYKLSATATYAIAIDTSRLEPIVKAYQVAVKNEADAIAKNRPEDLMKGSPANFVANSPAQLELADHLDPLWKAEQTLDVMRIKLADLNIGTDPTKNNQIPPNVIQALAPIIDP